MYSTEKTANNLTNLIVGEDSLPTLHHASQGTIRNVLHLDENEVSRFKDLYRNRKS
jgi:hypothetical protein